MLCLNKHETILAEVPYLLYIAWCGFLHTIDITRATNPQLENNIHIKRSIWFDLLCLTPLSAIFQLYHGDQF